MRVRPRRDEDQAAGRKVPGGINEEPDHRNSTGHLWVPLFLLTLRQVPAPELMMKNVASYE